MTIKQIEPPILRAFSMDLAVSLTAIVRPEESGGYSAEIPALPGCFTEGETLEELRANLREVAEGWLKAYHDLCPPPTGARILTSRAIGIIG